MHHISQSREADCCYLQIDINLTFSGVPPAVENPGFFVPPSTEKRIFLCPRKIP